MSKQDYFGRKGQRLIHDLDDRQRAKFPIHARTPKSRVYEYYNTDRNAEAKPVDIAVQ